MNLPDHEVAFALLAVSCNFFGAELYEKKGGKKQVKDCTQHNHVHKNPPQTKSASLPGLGNP